MYKLAVTHSILTWRKQCSPRDIPLPFIVIFLTIPHWPIMAPQTPSVSNGCGEPTSGPVFGQPFGFVWFQAWAKTRSALSRLGYYPDWTYTRAFSAGLEWDQSSNFTVPIPLVAITYSSSQCIVTRSVRRFWSSGRSHTSRFPLCNPTVIRWVPVKKC
jgi:hypothetical protein